MCQIKKKKEIKKDTGRSPHHSVALISRLSKQSVCIQRGPQTLEQGSLPQTQKKHFQEEDLDHHKLAMPRLQEDDTIFLCMLALAVVL